MSAVNSIHVTETFLAIYGFCLFCFFKSYQRPYLAHAGHIKIGRSLLTGHDALLLQQIARDLSHALSHKYDNTWTAFGEPVVGIGVDRFVTF